MTKEEFKSGIFPEKSSNYVKRIPVKTERLVKTIHQGKVKVKGASSFKNSNWFTKNFEKGNPINKVGGNNPKIKPYLTEKDLQYNASPDRFLTKAKKDL